MERAERPTRKQWRKLSLEDKYVYIERALNEDVQIWLDAAKRDPGALQRMYEESGYGLILRMAQR